MRAVDAFLRQMDDSWQHEWESLLPTLQGVTEEEAAWQAPCYRDETAASETPRAGTIHWHIAHLANCKHHYAACLRHRGKEGPTPVEPHEPKASFAESLEQLKQIQRAQREVIAALADEDLDSTVENGMSVAEYLTSTIRHDTWHAAQIVVARRLWRTRSCDEPRDGPGTG